jgi:uncharacterized MAPEG superfamily protein
MTIAFWCVLVAAFLPYAVFGLASAQLDILTPRKTANLEGRAAFAHGAHLNHFEAFPFFAAAVIIAHIVNGGPSALVNWLAVAFVLVRIFYTFMYLAGRQPLRSASFFVGLAIVVVIFISPVFH